MYILGNEKVKSSLQRIAEQSTHMLILEGKKGIGKSLIASELASKILTCPVQELSSNPDFFYMVPEKTTYLIEQVEKLHEKVSVMPVTSRKRVVIIDDADLLTYACQNYLLKLFEEQLEYNSFILISHGTLLSTIKSRSHTMKCKELSKKELMEFLSQHSYDEDTKNILLAFSDGAIGNIYRLINDNSLLQVYKSIYDFFRTPFQRDASILELFHFLKEKDDKNFYTLYKSDLDIFFPFMINLFYGLFCYLCSSLNEFNYDYKYMKDQFTIAECLYIIHELKLHHTNSKQSIYASDDFFSLLRILLK